MWLVMLGVLSLGLGILALIGLLVVARELFCDSSFDTNFADVRAKGRHGGRASGRCVTTR